MITENLKSTNQIHDHDQDHDHDIGPARGEVELHHDGVRDGAGRERQLPPVHSEDIQPRGTVFFRLNQLFS